MDRSEQSAAAAAAAAGTTSAGAEAEPAPTVPVAAKAHGGGYDKKSLPYRGHKLPTGLRAWRHLKYRQYKKPTDLVIRKSAFEGLVREIAQDIDKDKIGYRFEANAMESLQQAAEAELVLLFECSGKAMLAAKRVTLIQRDMHLAADVVKSFFPSPGIPGAGSKNEESTGDTAVYLFEL